MDFVQPVLLGWAGLLKIPWKRTIKLIDRKLFWSALSKKTAGSRLFTEN
jgi:hypothetical protein